MGLRACLYILMASKAIFFFFSEQHAWSSLTASQPERGLGRVEMKRLKEPEQMR